MSKTPNYTAEQTAELVAAYTAAESDAERKATVEEFAAKFGKQARSVVAKLSREGVYQKATPVGKRGGARKADLATQLGERLGLSENDADSLSKATLTALKAVVAALPDEDEDEVED